MKSIFRGIWKNLKVFFREKSSAAVVIFAPLLVVAVVGFALYANSSPEYPIGFISNEETSLRSVLDTDSFSLVAFDDTGECEERLRIGGVAACVTVNRTGTTEEVNVITDESRQDVAILLRDGIRERVQVESQRKRESTQEGRLDTIQQVLSDATRVQSSLQTASSRADDIKAEISDAESSLQRASLSVDIDIGDLDDSISSIESDVESLSSELEDLADSSSSYLNSSTANQSAKDSFTSSIESAEELLDTDFTSVDTALDDVSTLSSDISSVEEEASASEQERQDAVNKLESARQRVDTLQSSINSANTGLEEAISTLELLGGVSVNELAAPVTLQTETVATDVSPYLQLAPTLLSIALFMFSGLLGGVVVYSGRVGQGAVREKNLPFRIVTRYLINFFTSVFLGSLQFFLLLAALVFAAGFSLQFNFLGFLVFGTLGIVVAVALGSVLGGLFESIEGVTLSILSVCALFLFFSRAFFPIDTLGTIGEVGSLINPLAQVSDGIRRVVLLDVPLQSLPVPLYVLGGEAILFMLLSMFFYLNDERDTSKTQPEWLLSGRLAINHANNRKQLQAVVNDLSYLKYLRLRKYIKQWLQDRDFEEAAKRTLRRKWLFEED